MIYWELELEDISDIGMVEILESQKQEANSLFGKFIEKNYADWVNDEDEDAPVMSNTLFQKLIVPEVINAQGTLLLLIDNLRYDQCKVIEKTISKFYKKQDETAYCSILTNCNSIFEKCYFFWINAFRNGTKNILTYGKMILTMKVKIYMKKSFYKLN